MRKTQTLTMTVPDTKRWAALFVLCLAQFVVIMDTSIIGVALPAIQKDLGYSATTLQWIFNAYVVAFGGLLLLGGKLADLFGPRKIFMTGFGILTVASLIAGIAWSEAVLNIGRALQGLGSALIAPAALTLIMTTFTDQKELGKAFGFWGAAAAAGGSAGVFLGGVLTQWLSWEWVFFINIPLGLIVLFAGPQFLQEGVRRKSKIDVTGALLASSALVLLVYTIVTGGTVGWTSVSTIAQFFATILLFFAFIVRQKRISDPLVDLNIFKRFNLTSANIVMALLAASWIPLWFYLNLYLQQTLHLNAFNSGLALLPMTAAIMIIMVGFSGKLIQLFGFKKNLVLGLLLLTIALVWFSFAPVDGAFLTAVLGPSLLAAIGMSLAYIPVTMASMSGAKPEEAGLASGLVNTSYQIGSAIGLAIVVVIATITTSNLITTGMGTTDATNTGFQAAFVGASIIAGVSTIIAMLFVRMPKQ